MASTRLPGKVLADIAGQSMLAWIMERTQLASQVHQVVLATSDCPQDDALETWCAKFGFAVFRGSENDVLSRYYLAAKRHQADVIVRVTADDPFKDPELIDLAVTTLKESGAAYCSNTLSPTYPEGLDIEAFYFDVLQEAYLHAELLSEREHVTPFIWKQPMRFKLAEFKLERNLSDWRWTVDKPEDLVFANALVQTAGANLRTSYKELIACVDAHHDLLQACTNKTVRNEGYLKSIQVEGIKS